MARKINVKLILELREAKLSRNYIANSRHISRNSVSDVFRIADERGITYSDVRTLTEAEAYCMFYPDKHYGHYPERVLVDKIYRNRETIAWCKERGIQITGPALGRPPKDKEITKEAKKQEYQDICDRNIVEGEFGTGKRAYGLNRIMAHLPETSFCVIGVALLCMNLAKRLRSLCFHLLCYWFENQLSALAIQAVA